MSLLQCSLLLSARRLLFVGVIWSAGDGAMAALAANREHSREMNTLTMTDFMVTSEGWVYICESNGLERRRKQMSSYTERKFCSGYSRVSAMGLYQQTSRAHLCSVANFQ